MGAKKETKAIHPNTVTIEKLQKGSSGSVHTGHTK
jgi:hypothetical protein